MQLYKQNEMLHRNTSTNSDSHRGSYPTNAPDYEGMWDAMYYL